MKAVIRVVERGHYSAWTMPTLRRSAYALLTLRRSAYVLLTLRRSAYVLPTPMRSAYVLPMLNYSAWMTSTPSSVSSSTNELGASVSVMTTSTLSKAAKLTR